MATAQSAANGNQSFITRVESLYGQREENDAALSCLYREARGQGIDTKALKALVRDGCGSCGDSDLLMKKYRAVARNELATRR